MIKPTLLLLLLTPALAFHELLPPLASLTTTVPDVQHIVTAGTAAWNHASTLQLADNLSNVNPLSLYMNSLQNNPLETKMATGAVLALTGDGIAQSREDEPYDERRAASFALFDSAYRAAQHVLYPIVVQYCQGQYLSQSVSPLDTSAAAALEQTLVSQFLIVPFLYYPVFYLVTGFCQGLDWEGTKQRAQQTFVPLMKRNLLFWIPVQFVQFLFVPENLQIPMLSVCGLVWTLILSVMAGSAKAHQEPQGDMPEEEYCVTGMENECLIPEDGLFPDTNMQEITEEMIEMAHEVTEEFKDIIGSSASDDEEDTESAKEKEEELLLRK